MNWNAPSWLTFLIALLVVLAVLYLVGVRVNVG
jgi:predicted ferric reductase